MSGAAGTFAGFGFGPIQAGLFLYEAFRSANFDRLVVAELLPDAVSALRDAGGHYQVNIAHADRVERARIGPVEVYDPAVESDRHALVAAVAQAGEIATAVPSVQNYVSGDPGSIHRLLAQGLTAKVQAGGPASIVYAAENHNRAAEILEEAVLGEIPAHCVPSVRRCTRFVNTVIGKMSGVVPGADAIRARGLAPVVPGGQRAFLVESFNRILISRITPDHESGPRFLRGITSFEEKDNLLPFEEAKLYGHNATHSLAAYLAALRGLRFISELRGHPGLMAFIRDAFLEESGAALIARHPGVDPLFTPGGYREYADDLLARMLNPFLQDTVERVGRDPERKLGWDDRLVGTIRLARREGIRAWRYGAGAAAAAVRIDPAAMTSASTLRAVLAGTWGEAPADAQELRAVAEIIEQGRLLLTMSPLTSTTR